MFFLLIVRLIVIPGCKLIANTNIWYKLLIRPIKMYNNNQYIILGFKI